MFLQLFSRFVGSESRFEWKWITNTRIRPAFVASSVAKWGLIIALSTVWLAWGMQRDYGFTSLTLSLFIGGYLWYFITDQVAKAVLEDDPVLLRSKDKAP